MAAVTAEATPGASPGVAAEAGTRRDGVCDLPVFRGLRAARSERFSLRESDGLLYFFYRSATAAVTVFTGAGRRGPQACNVAGRTAGPSKEV